MCNEFTGYRRRVYHQFGCNYFTCARWKHGNLFPDAVNCSISNGPFTWIIVLSNEWTNERINQSNHCQEQNPIDSVGIQFRGPVCYLSSIFMWQQHSYLSSISKSLKPVDVIDWFFIEIQIHSLIPFLFVLSALMTDNCFARGGEYTDHKDKPGYF